MRLCMRKWQQLFENSSLATCRKITCWERPHRNDCRTFSTTDAGSFSDAIRAPGKSGVLLAFLSDNHEVPLDDKHRFPMSKYRLTRLALEQDANVRDLIEIREVTDSTEAHEFHHFLHVINACVSLMARGTGIRPGGFDRAMSWTSGTTSNRGRAGACA